MDELSEEQMTTLADMVAEKLKPAATAPAATAPAVTKPAVTQPLTAEGMQSMITGLITKLDGDKQANLMDRLYKDKLSTIESTPGMTEFLDSEDDWGVTNRKRLDAIEDYDQRVTQLTGLATRFSTASQSPNAAPTPKQVKHEKDTEKGYTDLADKVTNNEFENQGQIADAFFDLVNTELNTA